MAKFNLLQGLPSGLQRQIATKNKPGSASAPRANTAPKKRGEDAKPFDSAGIGGSTPQSGGKPKNETEPKGTPDRLKKWRAANKAKLAAYQKKWRAADKAKRETK